MLRDLILQDLEQMRSFARAFKLTVEIHGKQEPVSDYDFSTLTDKELFTCYRSYLVKASSPVSNCRDRR